MCCVDVLLTLVVMSYFETGATAVGMDMAVPAFPMETPMKEAIALTSVMERESTSGTMVVSMMENS